MKKSLLGIQNASKNHKTDCQIALKLIRNQKGNTAIEYGLIGSMIAVVIIGSISVLGDSLENTFSSIASSFSNLSSPAPSSPNSPATAPDGPNIAPPVAPPVLSPS